MTCERSFGGDLGHKVPPFIPCYNAVVIRIHLFEELIQFRGRKMNARSIKRRFDFTFV